MRPLRELWRRGGCAYNGWLALPCAFSAELMAKQRWDSLTIDMQHGLADHAAMQAMLTAAAPKPTLARVPWLNEADIMKTLDAGAAGVICPMISTAAEAERLADCVRYPPAGRRSFGPIRAQVCYGDDYYQRANDEVIALAMIETRQGLENVADILAVPGIDGVYIGPADLSCSLGCAPSFAPQEEEVLAAIDAIYAAAAACGAVAGIHTYDAQTAAARRRQGFQFITAAADARLISAGAAALLRQLHREDDHEKQTTDDSAGAGTAPDRPAY